MEVHTFLILLLTGHYVIVSCHPHQYSFVSINKTWTEAQAYCKERWGTLATATSAGDMELLTKAATDEGHGGDFWIGLYNSWQWSLAGNDDYSKEAEFQNWGWDEPHYDKKENCTVIEAPTGKWQDWPCETNFTFVCYDQGKSDPYIPVATPLSWSLAQNYCRTHHTDLAVITDEAQNQQVKNKVSGLSWQFTWIGLFRHGWRWSDTTGTTFNNWTFSQPVNGEGTCGSVSMGDSGIVKNRQCYIQMPFVCCYKGVVRKQIVRVKIRSESNVDMNNPALHTAIMEQIQQKLLKGKQQPSDIRLTWMKQYDGQIFHAEGDDTPIKKNRVEL
ncbi:C-type mannose receptor 2-like [Sardina pilchardus]|uniref:C-type mannose receptor 2-like n=1 Tax=Sardina pilchardus TaxID=27697 RepID=UPI002E129CA8